MSNKTIKINPDFFKIGNKGNSKQTTVKKTSNRNDKKRDFVQHKKTKKELLEKIKQFQQSNKDNINKKQNISHDKPIIKKNDIDDTLDYLDKAIKQKHKGKSKIKEDSKIKDKPIENKVVNREIKNPPIQIITNEIIPKTIPQLVPKIQHNQTVKKSNVKPDPPYGILKRGNKPTYSQYHTLKNKRDVIEIQGGSIVKNNPERKKKLDKIKHKNKKRMKKFKITTTTKTYKIGRNKDKRSVSILLKNNNTKKKVSHDIQLLKKTHIRDIKKYLKNKNMIKFTSATPEYILRDIYMNSMLSGDVENSNKSNLVYNYMNETT